MSGWPASIIGTKASLPVRRAILFIVCLALGCLIGFTGWYLSGSQWWFLAIPATLAAGWLLVATPERCLPQQGHGTGGGSSEAQRQVTKPSLAVRGTFSPARAWRLAVGPSLARTLGHTTRRSAPLTTPGRT